MAVYGILSLAQLPRTNGVAVLKLNFPQMLGVTVGLCALALSSGPFYQGCADLPEIQINQSWPLDIFFVYY